MVVARYRMMATRGKRRGLMSQGQIIFESQKLAHDLVVDLLALFGAQIEAHFIDDFDAVISEPFRPAVGANVGLNASAQVVVDRRARQLAGTGPPHAARGPAVGAPPPVPPRSRGFFLRRPPSPPLLQ